MFRVRPRNNTENVLRARWRPKARDHTLTNENSGFGEGGGPCSRSIDRLHVPSVAARDGQSSVRSVFRGRSLCAVCVNVRHSALVKEKRSFLFLYIIQCV
jgi:hypothetical protein